MSEWLRRLTRNQLGSARVGQFINDQRRLVEELLDPNFYEKTVHPKKDYTIPTRVNLSMSLYQILDVDEHMQSIEVNVWMVQHWYDEFLDWNPLDYGMINKTIVPYNQIWIPDTYLYNSEELEQKKTESLMNAQLETGYWTKNPNGAKVQLMFPAIYKLSCRMDVRWFPYDRQNCTFIISSWTHDKRTIDYWPLSSTVNLGNMARNDEWEVISFEFVRVEESFKCCSAPWVMLYAHLVIRRKPLYYMINLVIPTSIITIVAVTGFFTPTSSSSERDEKLWVDSLNLNFKQLTNNRYVQVPRNQYAAHYVGDDADGVQSNAVDEHLCAFNEVRRLIYNPVVECFVLSPPTTLLDLWTEFGVVSEKRHSTNFDPLLIKHIDPLSAKMKALRKNQYRMSMDTSQARSVKKQKMQRRCSLEWEFLANVLDRILLTVFCSFTFGVFLILIGFESIFTIQTKATASRSDPI
uniref:Neur_chan_LBD domain-containing protein n=2 Tax=Caenorhabditis japonica TaxID=281687 RepID=A0A8R1IFS8_CAEJA